MITAAEVKKDLEKDLSRQINDQIETRTQKGFICIFI